MKRRSAASLLLVGLALALGLAWWARSRPERVLYVGGPILTLDRENRVVEALGIEGDRIVALGSRSALEPFAARASRVVDLRGRALLPGFIDAHGHFPGAGLDALHANLSSPPVGDLESIEQLVERLARRAARTSEGDWVVGLGYDDTLLAEKRHPTRDDLDRASRQHPIVIWHVSGHLAVANSLGLEAIGLGAATPDPEGGRIRRRPGSREPDGVLEETAALPLQSSITRVSALDALTLVREASRRYVSQGVTTAQNGLAEPFHLRGFTWLSRLGLLPLRVVLWPDEAAADALLAGDLSFSAPDPDWLRRGAVKLVADGSIQGYTGYLTEPYHVPPGDDPTYRGYPVIERGKLAERVAHFHARGWQLAVHGNGDASIDDILDAFEAAQRAHPRADTRHVIVHAQMARDDQLDRMKELGVVPSFFVLHTYYWGDRHRDIFMGPHRAARMSPLRSAAERGVRFTIHADSPVVPLEPLRLVWSAVQRRSASGALIGGAQRIDAVRALRAVTIDAAWQHFEEDRKGSLEPGKLADLVILSESPLDAPDRIDRIRVLETIVGGRSVYRAPDA